MKPKIILALDVDSFARAKYFIFKLCKKITIFKVGAQLFTACGPRVIKLIQDKGCEAFLDLKFFDIPNTVGNAVSEATRLKVKMLTLHIMGGRDMLRAAVKAAEDEAHRFKIKRPLLIGVTILTSQQAHAFEVLKLAQTGLECGLDGVVCSAKEAALLRSKIKKQFVIVTPGIRNSEISKDDQKRKAAVAEAIRAGSNFLVIGRPILEAKDSLSVTQKIVNELNLCDK